MSPHTPTRKRMRNGESPSGSSSLSFFPPTRLPLSKSEQKRLLSGGRLQENQDEWIRVGEQPHDMSARKKFTFYSTPDGDQFHREKIVPGSEAAAPQDIHFDANQQRKDFNGPVLHQLPPRASTTKSIPVDGKGGLDQEINDCYSFSDSKRLLEILQLVLKEHNYSLEVLVKPMESTGSHVVRFVGTKPPLELISRETGSFDALGFDKPSVVKHVQLEVRQPLVRYNPLPVEAKLKPAPTTVQHREFSKHWILDDDLLDELERRLEQDNCGSDVSPRDEDNVTMVGIGCPTKPMRMVTKEEMDALDALDALGNKKPEKKPENPQSNIGNDPNALTMKNLAVHTVAAAQKKPDIIKEGGLAAGFLQAWPEQQPRATKKSTKMPVAKPPMNDRFLGGRAVDRRRGTPPLAMAVQSRPDQKTLDRSTVGVYVEGLPPGTTQALLVTEVRGGPIHSMTMFRAPLPGGDKKAVIYFLDPQSADRFVASHERYPVKVLGYKVVLHRQLPPEVLNSYPLPYLTPFRPDESRCIKLTNLPENKYPAVYITRWVDSIINGFRNEGIEFDHQTGSALLKFLSVDMGRMAKSRLINAKSTDIEWRGVRVEFTPDPCSMVH